MSLAEQVAAQTAPPIVESPAGFVPRISKSERDEEFEAKAVLKELERRRREEGFEFFEPQEYQKAFLVCDDARQIVAGGNRSGKTAVAIYKMVCHLTQSDPLGLGMNLRPAPVYWRVCGSGMEEQVEKVLVEYFRKFVPRRLLNGGKWNYSQRTHQLLFANGSWVEFMSFDQDPEKGAGRDLDGVLLDDVGCSKRFMEQCRARLVDRNGMMIRTLCPEEGITWEYDWWERAGNGERGYSRFKFRTLDNKFLSKEGVQQLIEDIGDDELQYRIRIEGDFLEAGGLIYNTLRKEHHMKEDAEVGFVPELHEWPTGVAIDPGVSKEHAVLWFAVGPGGHLHFYRELAMAGTIPDLCHAIRRESGLDQLQYLFIDGHWDWDNATAKSAFGAEPLNIEREFQKCGLPVVKAPRDIRNWQGIDQVRSRMKLQFRGLKDPMPQLTISPDCVRTWYEMTHYAQVPPKKSDPSRHNPRIRKVDDDFCDCVRIAVTSNPQYVGSSGTQLYSTVMTDEYGITF